MDHECQGKRAIIVNTVFLRDRFPSMERWARRIGRQHYAVELDVAYFEMVGEA